MPGDGPFLFISRVDEDTEFAEWLCDKLEAKDHACWIAARNIGVGVFPLQIQDAAEDCGAMVVVMSSKARRSEWVMNEALYAIQIRKPLLIAHCDDSYLPIYLVARDAINFSEKRRSAGLRRLLDVLDRTDLGEPLPVPTTTAQRRRQDPSTNRTTFFLYLKQLTGGSGNVAVARFLDRWAKGTGLSVEFSGVSVPSLHTRLEVGGEEVTVASVLAFPRQPSLEIPFGRFMKLPPYDDRERRLATLDALNGFLAENEKLEDERADALPRLPLSAFGDSDEKLERLEPILQEIVDNLRAGG